MMVGFNLRFEFQLPHSARRTLAIDTTKLIFVHYQQFNYYNLVDCFPFKYLQAIDKNQLKSLNLKS